jgi:hypothetical protein
MKPVKGGQGPVWAVAPLIIIIMRRCGPGLRKGKCGPRSGNADKPWLQNESVCEVYGDDYFVELRPVVLSLFYRLPVTKHNSAHISTYCKESLLTLHCGWYLLILRKK